MPRVVTSRPSGFWLDGRPVASRAAGAPSAANIDLRKQNQQLQASVDDAHGAAQAGRRGPGRQRGGPAVAADAAARPARPPVHRARPGVRPADRRRQPRHGHRARHHVEGVRRPDRRPGHADQGGRGVHRRGVRPGQPRPPAGGHVAVLGRAGPRACSSSRFALYTYVLECPWQTVPPHPDLTVKVTFDDELTGRRFVDQTQVKVHPAATTRPLAVRIRGAGPSRTRTPWPTTTARSTAARSSGKGSGSCSSRWPGRPSRSSR